MSDGLKPTMFSEVEHTVESGAHRYASRVVVCGSESSERLSFDILHHSSVRIIDLLHVAEEPVHTIAYTWRDIYIFQQGKVRKSDLEIMVHAILELIKESRLVEFRRLEIDLVLE